jgi:NAD(P)H-flavin reductase
MNYKKGKCKRRRNRSMQTPRIFRILSNVPETEDIFTLILAAKDRRPFSFLPGQFNMLYLYGIGEVAISISSDPAKPHELVHTIRAVGAVTNGMQKLNKNDEIAVRGPFGTCWPLSRQNSDLLIIAGGTGLCPLRSALYYLALHRSSYGKITVLHGTRTPRDIMYQHDISLWRKAGIETAITVDKADSAWKGPTGVVTPLIAQHVQNPSRTIVMICGPEIMIRFAVQELAKAGVQENQVYLSMERNMQCGVGICGHCQMGPYFICKDGPVFQYSQLKPWLAIKEL